MMVTVIIMRLIMLMIRVERIALMTIFMIDRDNNDVINIAKRRRRKRTDKSSE